MRYFAGILLLAATAAWAAPETPRDSLLPSYTVRRALQPIVVDGKMDDPDWRHAPWTEPFVFPWETQDGPKQRTQAKLLWDDTNLYVLYQCEDIDAISRYTQRDDPVYNDDCVEIFINPNPSRSDFYYGLEMSCSGVNYDYFFAFPVTLLPWLNMTDVQLKTTIDGTLNRSEDTDRGWTLELAIPFANLKDLQSAVPPRPGTSWRVNLNRWDSVGTKRRLSQWSNSGKPTPNPHAPDRFGVITFSAEPKTR